MKITCLNCGKRMDVKQSNGICPRCGFYNKQQVTSQFLDAEHHKEHKSHDKMLASTGSAGNNGTGSLHTENHVGLNDVHNYPEKKQARPNPPVKQARPNVPPAKQARPNVSSTKQTRPNVSATKQARPNVSATKQARPNMPTVGQTRQNASAADRMKTKKAVKVVGLIYLLAILGGFFSAFKPWIEELFSGDDTAVTTEDYQWWKEETSIPTWDFLNEKFNTVVQLGEESYCYFGDISDYGKEHAFEAPEGFRLLVIPYEMVINEDPHLTNTVFMSRDKAYREDGNMDNSEPFFGAMTPGTAAGYFSEADLENLSFTDDVIDGKHTLGFIVPEDMTEGYLYVLTNGSNMETQIHVFHFQID